MGNSAVFVHHLYCPVRIKGSNQKGIAKLYVTETYEGTKKFYLNKIEMSPDTMVSTNNGSTWSNSSASSDTISISEIFNFVKRHDKDYEADSKYPVFFNPKEPSKIVNADGTPMIMYHGSPEQFTAFDKSKAKASGTYGRGFYFTNSDSHAKQYGNLYAVYLDVKNPLKQGESKVTESQIRKFLFCSQNRVYLPCEKTHL